MAKELPVLRPTQVVEFIQIVGHANGATMIWGAPGIGKSDLTRQVAEKMSTENYAVPVYDVRLLNLDPTDVKGLPYINGDNKAVWADPSILPPSKSELERMVQLQKDGEDITFVEFMEDLVKSNGKAILFLDEITAAPPSIQAAAYQLVLDRAVGDYKLPDGVIIVAAGNRTQDAGVSFKMPTPLANRFSHCELRVNADEWLDWAINAKIHPAVVSFIGASKGKLFDDQFTKAGAAFATPRSWEKVSNILYSMEELGHDIYDDNSESMLTLINLVGGTVGTGTATEFKAHMSHASNLPRPSDILDGKIKVLDKSVKLENKTSAQYFLSTSLCYELSQRYDDMMNDPKANDASEEAFHTGSAENFLGFFYNNDFSTEIVIMSIRQAMGAYNIDFDTVNSVYWDKLYEENSEVFRASLSLSM